MYKFKDGKYEVKEDSVEELRRRLKSENSIIRQHYGKEYEGKYILSTETREDLWDSLHKIVIETENCSNLGEMPYTQWTLDKICELLGNWEADDLDKSYFPVETDKLGHISSLGWMKQFLNRFPVLGGWS